MNDRKLALLFALQEQPTESDAKLAEVVGVTPPTARAWLQELRKNKVYLGVKANLRLKRIGLELDDFYVGVKSFDALKKIEDFCRAHPYTSYRARIYGGDYQGVLLQFRQPDGARKHLEEALHVLQEDGLINHIRELPTLNPEYGSTYTRPKLDAWNSEKMTWHFDWDSWWDTPLSEEQTLTTRTSSSSSRIELDELDVYLIQEFTRDVRRKNVDIIRKIGLDPETKGIQQMISSKITRLKEKIVESYRIFINWNHLDIYNTPLIIAKADSAITDQLVFKLQSGTFPFGSSIRKTPTGFVWSSRLPSAHMSELVKLVWKVAQSYELLMLDYKHSLMYVLWAETFGKEEKAWKDSREFCFETPLKQIGLF